MMQDNLSLLYEADETAWLEQTANLIQAGKYDGLDYQNLADYLLAMARRDRREVRHRLISLVAHRLKWDHCEPALRPRSWVLTMLVQRHELESLCESPTLRDHALELMPLAYERAREEIAAETALPESRFPAESPYTLDDLLEERLPNQ